jgi:hypothetical protein
LCLKNLPRQFQMTTPMEMSEEKLTAIIERILDAKLRPAIDAALKPAIDAALKPAIDAALKPAIDAALKPAIAEALQPIEARLSALEKVATLRREAAYRKGMTRYQLRQHLSEDYRTFHDLVGELPAYVP